MRVFSSVQDLTSAVGQTIGVSDWLLIDQQRISQFADVTGDHHWIHVDVERARTEMPAGATIAHGLLSLSLIPLLKRQIDQVQGLRNGLNYGFNKVRFITPVQVGARVRLHAKLMAAQPRADGLLVTYQFTLEVEEQQRPSLQAEMLMLLFPGRETAQSAAT
jgi:acyl dehydratase